MSKPLQRRTTSHGANGGMLDRRVTLMDIDQLQEDGAYLPTADDAEIVADVEQSSSEPLSASASHAQAFKFGLTGLSAMTAESATFPVDMCKTRMQLSGEGVGGARQSIFGAAAEIVRREGPLGLYAGVSPAICRHIPYTGSRVGLYESLRGRFTTPGVEAGIATKMAIGFTAGGLAQLIAVPFDVIKVRMQSDGRLVAQGKLAAPRYSGVADALGKIARTEGVSGLWSGAKPAVARAALVNLGELATYDTAKRAILRADITGGDNVGCHTLSAVTSGFFAALVSTPADVIKTRLMNQTPGVAAYRGPIDCLVRTARTEGPLALYKGFLPGWARLGPWQLTFWVTYEQLRMASGVGGF